MKIFILVSSINSLIVFYWTFTHQHTLHQYSLKIEPNSARVMKSLPIYSQMHLTTRSIEILRQLEKFMRKSQLKILKSFINATRINLLGYLSLKYSWSLVSNNYCKYF